MGVRFEALCKGILMAAMDFSCNFFRILTFGYEQCVECSINFLLVRTRQKWERTALQTKVEDEQFCIMFEKFPQKLNKDSAGVPRVEVTIAIFVFWRKMYGFNTSCTPS